MNFLKVIQMYISVHNVKDTFFRINTLDGGVNWEQEGKFLYQNTKLPLIIILGVKILYLLHPLIITIPSIYNEPILNLNNLTL